MILYRAIIATFSSEISSLSPSWKAKFTNLLWSGFTRQADLPNISHDECVVSSRTRGSAIRLSLGRRGDGVSDLPCESVHSQSDHTRVEHVTEVHARTTIALQRQRQSLHGVIAGLATGLVQSP